VRSPESELFFDETDVATTFEAGFFYFRDIVLAQAQAHILFDIVCGDMVAAHGFYRPTKAWRAYLDGRDFLD
jgi:hypothetical protein